MGVVQYCFLLKKKAFQVFQTAGGWLPQLILTLIYKLYIQIYTKDKCFSQSNLNMENRYLTNKKSQYVVSVNNTYFDYVPVCSINGNYSWYSETLAEVAFEVHPHGGEAAAGLLVTHELNFQAFQSSKNGGIPSLSSENVELCIYFLESWKVFRSVRLTATALWCNGTSKTPTPKKFTDVLIISHQIFPKNGYYYNYYYFNFARFFKSILNITNILL